MYMVSQLTNLHGRILFCELILVFLRVYWW